jgi:hypothetical protein
MLDKIGEVVCMLNITNREERQCISGTREQYLNLRVEARAARAPPCSSGHPMLHWRRRLWEEKNGGAR